MRPAHALLGTFLAIGLIASGCGRSPSGGDAGSGAESGTPSSASASPSAADQSAQDRIIAKIAAQAPPKDLRWRIGTSPSHWRLVRNAHGETQWRVGTSHCVVALSQPGDLGTSRKPTSIQVARHYARLTVRAATRERPVVRSGRGRLFSNVVTGSTLRTGIRFAEVHLVAKSAGVRDEVFALRSGDFALVVQAACGRGQYARFHRQMLDFVDHQLAVQTTY